MNISLGIVSSSLSRAGGGIFPIVQGQARALAASGAADITLYGLEDEATELDRPAWGSLPIRTYRGRLGPLGYAPDLIGDLLKARHDILHQHGLWMYPSRAVSRWHDKVKSPYLISVQGMLEPWALRNSLWKKRVAGWLFQSRNLRDAACLHCSEGEVAGIRSLGLKNPLCVLGNAVDLPLAEAGLGEPVWGRHEQRKVLLYLGRIHPKKGLMNLLRGWARLLHSRKSVKDDWLLCIAGWDQEGHAAELEALSNDLIIRGNVLFAGPLFGNQKDIALRRAAAFVLPSFSEGQPMGVLEAWSYGLPVLMTKGCNLSVGFDAGAAIEIDPSTDGIATALDAVLGLPDKDLRLIGNSGHRLVASEFSWDKVGQGLLVTYRWILRGGQRPDCVLMS